MYRANRQSELPDFYLPFGGKLDPENRWVKLARIVPWYLVEEDYRANFADSGMGAPAKESRIALGALIIKERLGVTPTRKPSPRSVKTPISNTSSACTNTSARISSIPQ